MNYSCFVGIDVSKSTFDAYFIFSQSSSHQVFENTDRGFGDLIKWLISHKIDISKSLFCAEAMGNYVLDLSLWLHKRNLFVCLACPLKIKRTMGIQRGKSDKIDAYRITKYIEKHHQDLALFSPKDSVLEELNSWMIIRNQLVKNQTCYSKILKQEQVHDKHYAKGKHIKFTRSKLEEIKREIKYVEQQIRELFDKNKVFNQNLKLLESIPGIGLINACMLICTTHNFTKFQNHRQFACFCGVAPFEYSSGTSIRGKTRVSPLANKKIKTYLTSAAVTAVRWDKQLKIYYQRKTEEGKHKASVLNAVKAKLIARCFAVIRRQKPYVKLDF